MPGLREQAEADLVGILENTGDFGWNITVTSPVGLATPLVGYSTDISLVIDPETGQAVSGRLASVALRISTLITKGIAIPQGEADSTKKPWQVTFNDINGVSHTFKVKTSAPDRAIGIVTLILELYTP